MLIAKRRNRPDTISYYGCDADLAHLKKTIRVRQDVFAALTEAVKTHNLGQISHALYDVGGE